MLILASDPGSSAGLVTRNPRSRNPQLTRHVLGSSKESSLNCMIDMELGTPRYKWEARTGGTDADAVWR